MHSWSVGVFLLSDRAAFIQGDHVVGNRSHAALVLHLLRRAHGHLAVSALRAAEVACSRSANRATVVDSVVLVIHSAHARLLHLSQFKWFLDSVFAIGRLGHAPLPAAGTLSEEYVRILACFPDQALTASAGPRARSELLRRQVSLVARVHHHFS